MGKPKGWRDRWRDRRNGAKDEGTRKARKGDVRKPEPPSPTFAVEPRPPTPVESPVVPERVVPESVTPETSLPPVEPVEIVPRQEVPPSGADIIEGVFESPFMKALMEVLQAQVSAADQERAAMEAWRRKVEERLAEIAGKVDVLDGNLRIHVFESRGQIAPPPPIRRT